MHTLWQVLFCKVPVFPARSLWGIRPLRLLSSSNEESRSHPPPHQSWVGAGHYLAHWRYSFSQPDTEENSKKFSFYELSNSTFGQCIFFLLRDSRFCLETNTWHMSSKVDFENKLNYHPLRHFHREKCEAQYYSLSHAQINTPLQWRSYPPGCPQQTLSGQLP